MANMLFKYDNRVEVQYGVYGPSSGRTHNGIDVDTTNTDWTVHSTTDGKCVTSTIITDHSNLTWEWGNYVCILDNQGYRHYYCHLNSRTMSVGQVVKAGDIVGIMGKTGNAAMDRQAEHVHYEVRKSPYGSANHVNPTQWCGIPNTVGITWNNNVPIPDFEYDYPRVPSPVTDFSYCIDISQHQGTFDANKAKTNGIKTVICRANYAERKDTKFDEFTQKASNVGLLVGAYYFANWHYSVVSGNYYFAKENAIKQTNYFLNVIKSAPITSFVALDMEYESGYTTVLSKAQLTELSNMCMDMMKAAGYTPLLYVGADWCFNKLVTDSIAYPLWIAYYYRYGTITDFKDGTRGYFPNTSWGKKMLSIDPRVYMWQFTSEGYGSKYGVGSTGLDKNYCYVNMKQSVNPEPTPDPDPKPSDNSRYLLKSIGSKNMQGFASMDVNGSVVYNNMPNGYRVVTKSGLFAQGYEWVELVDERNGNKIYTPLLSDRNGLIKDYPFLGV